MQLKQTIAIDAPPESVWLYLADPILQAAWNPKVVSLDRDHDGPVQLGERFEMLYRMSGQDRLSRVEVKAVSEPEQLVFEHTLDWKGKTMTTQESYSIDPLRHGVRVTQTIDLSQAGIPWPIRILIGLIHRFGKAQEAEYLKRLKHMIESDTG